MTRTLAALLATSALVPVLVHAQVLPTGGSVVAGAAHIGAPQAGSLAITQSSDRAVIDWGSFSVGAGGRVTIAQPTAASALLNRVTGSATSTIAGEIDANGRVFLVNPNGILITRTGVVNTAGFVASTLNVTDTDFMSGRLRFTGAGGAVSNQGAIRIVRGGFAALIGGQVDNGGLILAPLGKVALGSGTAVTLDFAGDGFLQVGAPTTANGGVGMSGQIVADGGAVILSAGSAVDATRHTVNLSGVIEARGLDAKGGAVTLTGGDIVLAGATIDASGATGGGTVRVGGDKQGLGALAHAQTVSIDAASTIDTRATTAGDGGDVVVWSDTATAFAGAIDARGAAGGAGGDAEVSSHGRLAYTGAADLRGARFGTLLLDPYNVTISTAVSSNQSAFTATGNDSVINATTLTSALSAANVTVATGASGTQAGTITVAAPLAWTSASTLTVQAAGAINLNAAVTAAAGGLTLSSGGAIGATGAVSVARFTLASGNWLQNTAALPGFAAGNFGITGGSFVRTTGGVGTAASPYLLTDIFGLQGVGSSAPLLGASWQLAGDIDASGTAAWNGGAGFAPIGNSSAQFFGSLNGAGHVVSGLTINRPATNSVGLVGYLGGGGRVTGIGIAGGSTTGYDNIGGLVGENDGTVAQSYATGAVSGASGAYGLGGLVGENVGTVTQSYATGAVSGASGSQYVGGLAGFNAGTVTQSYATGAVSGASGSQFVGGLVGLVALGAVTQSYSTGAVSGTYYVGGLVGENDTTLSSDYWDTATSGRSNAVGYGSASGASGLTTAQARASNSYAGFDFTNVWYQAGDLRPILRSEAATAVGGVITVSNLHQLQLMGANLAGSYSLTANIDASPTNGANAAGVFGAGGFVPIGGSATPFTGSLNGAGHMVSGLVINQPSTDYAGLVGYLGAGGQISAVGIVGGSVTGAYYTGGLVGYSYGTVTQSYATDVVSGAAFMGGLIGASNGPVTQSYATGAVSGRSGAPGGGQGVGGLIGRLDGTVTQAYATGAVSGTYDVGGLVGLEESGTVTQSYATGAVTGTNHVGGLVGANYVGNLSGNYWDTTTSGQSSAVGFNSATGATGLTTAQMQDVTAFRTNFAGFDFATVWAPPSDAAHSSDGIAHFPEFYALTNVIAVTPGAATRVYGNGAGVPSAATYVGAHAGDSVTALGSFADTATSTSNVGNYAIDATGVAAKTAGGLSYRIVYVPGVDTVTQRSITIAADSLSRVYGAANPALTYTIGGLGLVNGDTLTGSLATAATLTSSVGSFGISQGSLTASGNYSLAGYTPGTLSITARPITVVANAQNGVYGNADPALTYTVGGLGLVNGDTLAGGLATVATPTSNVGAYGITQGSLAASSNYALGYTGATFTIGQRALAVTANAQSGIYGNADPALTYTVGGLGLVNGDTLAGGLATVATPTSNVGAYGITQGSLAASSNYALGYTGAAFTIGQRAAVVYANAQSGIYGNADPALTYMTFGLVNGDVLFGALATAATGASNVGAYVITQGSLTAGGNYTLGYNRSLFTIGPRALTVTAGPESRIYGNANPLTGTATGDNLVNGDTVTLVSLTTPATTASNVGAYDLTGSAATGSGLANYSISYATRAGGLTIGQRSLSVIADSQSGIYGNADPALTYTVGGLGLVNGDTLTGALATAATSASNVGVYGITRGSLSASPNYALGYTGATFTIGQRALTVTADPASRIYGNANSLTGTATGDNLVNGDTVTLVSLSSPATTASNVGAYDLTGSAATGSGLANYAISYATRTGGLTIGQRSLTVIADSQSGIYGNADPALTYTVGGLGLVNGDTLTGALATSATSASNVGAYGITQGGLAASSNYALGYTGATFTIGQRALTVTADPASRIYGNANPLTGTATGDNLVNGDTVTLVSLSTPATTASNVGAYDLTGSAATGSGLANYAISYATRTGGLTIGQRSLTVIADAQSGIYGNADPALTYTVGGLGLVNGDTLSGGLATSATSASNVGAYGITQGGLAASSNYALGYTGATFTIGQRALTVTADPASRIYGNANPLTGTATGDNLVNGDTVTLVSLSTPATTASNVGAYDLTGSAATGSGLANYAISYATRTGGLTIGQRALSVTADSQSGIYGNADPALTYTVGGLGLVNGDTLTGALATAATSASNVGAYGITQGGLAASSNYALGYTGATFTIGQRALNVTADPQNRIYGDANPLTGTATGDNLVNGDTVTLVSLSTPATTASNVGAYDLTGSAATGSGLANYAINYATQAGGLTITPRALGVTANDASKTYDGLAFGGGAGVTYLGFTNGQDVSALGGALTYGGSSQGAVGAGSYGIAPLGLTSANYAITFNNGTLTVAQAPITVTALGGTSVYGASPVNPGLSAAGLVNGENPAVLTGLANSFAITRTSGVGASPYTLEVAGALSNPNYVVAGVVNGLWTITPAQLTASLTGTVEKTYDANAIATLSAANYSLGGVLNGDAVALNDPTAGTYGNSNAGIGKFVNVSGLALTGAAAADYIVNGAVSGAVGIIDPKTLTVNLIGTTSRVYDGTLAAALTAANYSLPSGVIAGDVVAVNDPNSGTYDSKNVGANKLVTSIVTLSGAQAGNYAIGPVSGAIGAITPKAITVALKGTVQKIYDGTTKATLAAANTIIAGEVAGDSLAVVGAATYSGPDAGSKLRVTVNGAALAGGDASDYSLSTASYSGLVGTIKAKALIASLIGPIFKVYDGSTAATLTSANYGLSGVVAGDTVALNDPTAGVYATKNAGSGIKVTVSGLALLNNAKHDYTVKGAITASIGVIGRKSLTASLTGVVDKTYDGTTRATLVAGDYLLSGVVAADAPTVLLNDPTAGVYDTKNVGAGKIVTVAGLKLSGAGIGNYVLAAPTITGAVGQIDAKAVTVSLLGAVTKFYDGSTAATLMPLNYGVTGFIAGDAVSLNNPIVGAYATPDRGSYKTVTVGGLALLGADSFDYVLGASTVSGAVGVIR